MSSISITFVSNYMNHHQLPFCEAVMKEEDVDFTFIQTQAMEEERKKMGWEDYDGLGFVRYLYDDPEGARALIRDSDVVLYGWAPEVAAEIRARAAEGKPLVCISERLYREGQWRMFSPRGLVDKYRNFVRFRDKPYYLFCAGAYVASDFSLIHAFPGKMLRWGYFPQLRRYAPGELEKIKDDAQHGKTIEVTWAGRFLELKHPEFALRLAKDLKDMGVLIHLNMIGAGDKDEECRCFAQENGIEDNVTFHGFLPADEVRGIMEKSRVFLFTSDHGEGWGAVVNEAMNSGCAVIAGSEAGCVPVLIRNGVSGVIYNRENYDDFLAKAYAVITNKDLMYRLGAGAARTIGEIWNEEVAAKRLVPFCRSLKDGKDPMRDAAMEGPLSPAPVLKPFLSVPVMRLEKTVSGMLSTGGGI